MNKQWKKILTFLLVCLLVQALAVGAFAESLGMFFAGYRWLSKYSALYTGPDMTHCAGITGERGLIWVLQRESGLIKALYADQNGGGGVIYVEESRISRADRAEINEWLDKTKKEMVQVEDQKLPPILIGQLSFGPQTPDVPSDEEAVPAIQPEETPAEASEDPAPPESEEEADAGTLPETEEEPAAEPVPPEMEESETAEEPAPEDADDEPEQPTEKDDESTVKPDAEEDEAAEEPSQAAAEDDETAVEPGPEEASDADAEPSKPETKEEETAEEEAKQDEEPPLSITRQPEDQQVQPGKEVTFSVEAVSALSYQWQYSKDEGETWDDLKNAEFWHGCKTDTLTFATEEKHLAFLFRCAVSGKEEQLTSEPVRVTFPDKVIAFDEAPSDRVAEPGESVSFRAALADTSKLQWQYSSDEGKSWHDLTNGEFWQGNKSDTLTFRADIKYNGFLFRVKALYRDETVFCEPAQLVIVSDPEALPRLIAQTCDLSVHEEESVTLSIEAENAKEYEWQYSNDGGESWKPLTNAEIWEGNRSNILTFTALKNYDQLQFRCVVSNQDGSVKSQPILLTVLTD